MTISQNGNRPDSSNRKTLAVLSSKASWYKSLGKIFEVVAVLVFTCILSVFWVASGQKLIAGVIVAATAGLLCVAAEFSFRGAKASKALAEEMERQASQKKHVLSDARLRTLIEAKVPDDVIVYLRSLVSLKNPTFTNAKSNNGQTSNPPTDGLMTTTSELLSSLRRDLGPERTDDVKDVILKYTEVSAETHVQ